MTDNRIRIRLVESWDGYRPGHTMNEPAHVAAALISGGMAVRDTEIKQLTVAELRAELRALGLTTTGIKPELAARLREARKK